MSLKGPIPDAPILMSQILADTGPRTKTPYSPILRSWRLTHAAAPGRPYAVRTAYAQRFRTSVK
jgi:hypothetical protein